jgi:hypothetical protein
MTAKPAAKLIPIYNTVGDWEAFMLFPYLYNVIGEWVGWATTSRQVYDVEGYYVGWLTDEPRILRKRTYDRPPARRSPPPSPSERARPPATVPLPPMMAELTFEVMDVLFEEPERLHTTDTGELKQDMD